MTYETALTFPEAIGQALKKHSEHNALSLYGKTPITYNDVAKGVAYRIHQLESLGFKQNDKVAILGQNSPNWGVSFLSLTFMGIVAVPLLPDFSESEIINVLNHSEAKAIIISDSFKSKYKTLQQKFKGKYLDIDDIQFDGTDEIKTFDVKEDDLASIIYTSGTTGKSKGVMLTQKNIIVNGYQGQAVTQTFPTDRFLSILPLSHTLEGTVGFVLPLLGGSCIYYLEKLPTPAVLLPVLKDLKPTIMLTVPIIIEKIFRNRVYPEFQKKAIVRTLYKVPTIRKKLHKLAGKKLMETFGGELRFFGIGGAKVDPVVERFMLEADFPYAIGYGLTETAPLLAGRPVGWDLLESTGKAVPEVEFRINDPDPITQEGEIWAKGPNVMKGYYKEPEITAEVLTEDGWFRTGDLGTLDKDNNLYIKGRLKNVIIGPNGKNIYPEEIESLINNFKFVLESVVVEKKGKLVAFVHFNKEELEKKYHHLKEEITHMIDSKMEELQTELQHYVNQRVNKYSQIHHIILQQDPFQKTATKKIKRFLYA